MTPPTASAATADSPPAPFAEDPEAVAAAHGADLAEGLTGAEAARRLAADGPNELPSTPPEPAWKRLLAQFRDPLVYLLLGAIVVSAVTWALEGAHGAPVDALIILLVITLNAVLGFVQESRAADAVAALSAMKYAIWKSMFLRYLSHHPLMKIYV